MASTSATNLTTKMAGMQRRTQVKNSILFRAVDSFFDSVSNFEQFYQIVHKVPKRRYRKPAKPRMSLRLIDYAVSTYSLGGALTVIKQPRQDKPEQESDSEDDVQENAATAAGPGAVVKSVHSVYTAGISSYGRSHYDAFRRNNSFLYERHGKAVKTTLAQLVFFRDLIRYNILGWIHANIDDIKSRLDAEFPKAPRRTRALVSAVPGSLVQKIVVPIKL